uniref:Uncharacterized protein n=1 Tax=Anguilla anguilla TaxID=7936 RepID=A0A0E9QBA5_ANGAN
MTIIVKAVCSRLHYQQATAGAQQGGINNQLLLLIKKGSGSGQEARCGCHQIHICLEKSIFHFSSGYV